MRVLQACAEFFPLLKTGGLADVAGALPSALQRLGADVRVLLPGFAPILESLKDARLVAELAPPGALGTAPARLLHGRLEVSTAGARNIEAYVIDAPDYYLRPGGPYADSTHQPYPDNHLRFALLGWTTAQLGLGLDQAWTPAVVHAHDWHAALAPAYLRAAASTHQGRVPASVFTIHNLAYQGLFNSHHFAELGLPEHFFAMHGIEFHGQINFMKAGLYYADRITTVSPRYALEIQEPEQGCGLDGLLRDRAHELFGILNGVDEAIWDPATDEHLTSTYSAAQLAGKTQCKAALQRELGLRKAGRAPLFCVVSRLTQQKGLHLVLKALPALIAQGGQFALLGSGDPDLEAAFTEAAKAHPEAVAVRLGYDEPFAHRLIAGSDVIMVPSHFEPCGLTQLYGLKYGTLPLVRKVGGLADTVADSRLETLDHDATGFVFEAFSADGLLQAAARTLALYRRKADWTLVQRRAMALPCGWDAPAAHYLALYERLLN